MSRDDGNPKNSGLYYSKMVQYGNYAHACQAAADVQWIFVFGKIIIKQQQTQQYDRNGYNQYHIWILNEKKSACKCTIISFLNQSKCKIIKNVIFKYNSWNILPPPL